MATQYTKLGYVSDTMPAEYQPLFAGDFPRACKDVTLVSGTAALVRGTILGKITTGALSAATAAYSGNTGDGTMGTVTLSAGAMAGVYKLTVIEPGTNAGTFEVEAPDGTVVGTGAVAAAFSAGGLAFTLADGSTDFVAGDGFNITVTAAAGSGKYGAYSAAATDGLQNPVGILGIDMAASTTGDQPAWMWITGEFNEDELTGVTSAAKTALEAQNLYIKKVAP